MDLNDLYFEKQKNKNNFQLDKNFDKKRSLMADREVVTFVNLLSLSGLKNLNNLNDLKILDLGSGDQFLKHSLTTAGADYTPIDYDTANFNKDSLPFDDNEFEIIISLAVIEHIENISHFLSEVRRVLKPKGILYLSTPNFKYCYRTFYNDPTHIRPFTDVSIARLLEIFKFQNINTFPGARCKNNWFYKGKTRFLKCAILPFREKRWYCPAFLSGKATSVIAIAQKSS